MILLECISKGKKKKINKNLEFMVHFFVSLFISPDLPNVQFENRNYAVMLLFPKI